MTQSLHKHSRPLSCTCACCLAPGHFAAYSSQALPPPSRQQRMLANPVGPHSDPHLPCRVTQVRSDLAGKTAGEVTNAMVAEGLGCSTGKVDRAVKVCGCSLRLRSCLT